MNVNNSYRSQNVANSTGTNYIRRHTFAVHSFLILSGLDRLARVVLLVQLESDFFLAGDIVQEVTYAPQIEIVRFYSPSLEPR